MLCCLNIYVTQVGGHYPATTRRYVLVFAQGVEHYLQRCRQAGPDLQ